MNATDVARGHVGFGSAGDRRDDGIRNRPWFSISGGPVSASGRGFVGALFLRRPGMLVDPGAGVRARFRVVPLSRLEPKDVVVASVPPHPLDGGDLGPRGDRRGRRPRHHLRRGAGLAAAVQRQGSHRVDAEDPWRGPRRQLRRHLPGRGWRAQGRLRPRQVSDLRGEVRPPVLRRAVFPIQAPDRLPLHRRAVPGGTGLGDP